MRVVIGRIGRPHGIRGEVTVEPRTDEPDRRFASGCIVLTGDSHLVVEYSSWHGTRLIVKFEGVGDRGAAELLRGTVLEVDRGTDDRPDDPDEYYDTDLIGMRAVLSTGEDFGTVREILHLPGQDVVAIDRAGTEVLLPFVQEFVPQVDLQSRQMTVEPPPGLVDD